MTVKIHMPKMGFDMEEGIIGEWLKQKGDQVNAGDAIVEIITDKATVEVEAFESGTLTHILVETGESAPVGAVLALLDGEEDDLKTAATQTRTESIKNNSADSLLARENRKQSAKSGGSRGKSIQITPLARRMAKAKGFDPASIEGRGRDGMIVKADVLAYEEQQEKESAAPLPETVDVRTAPVRGEREALSKMRQTIARRMSLSNQEVPHFAVSTSANMTPLLALRKQYNDEAPEARKLSINDFVLRAAALALRKFPRLNASYIDDKIEFHDSINMSMAIALDEGLITVVIPETDSKALSQIAIETKALIQRARDGKLRSEDLEGSTFTVSNLGMFNVETFTAIINPPEAAILAVGAVQELPWNVDGEIKLQSRIKMTLSVDHRVSDGAEAANYLQHLTEYLEKPTRMI